jgi:hypothetical protein
VWTDLWFKEQGNISYHAASAKSSETARRGVLSYPAMPAASRA